MSKESIAEQLEHELKRYELSEDGDIEGLFLGYMTAYNRNDRSIHIINFRPLVRLNKRFTARVESHLISQHAKNLDFPSALCVRFFNGDEFAGQFDAQASWLFNTTPKITFWSFAEFKGSRTEIFNLINRVGMILEQPDEYYYENGIDKNDEDGGCPITIK